jgi:hypothetical protein
MTQPIHSTEKSPELLKVLMGFVAADAAPGPDKAGLN